MTSEASGGDDVRCLRAQIARLSAENTRLLKLLQLTPAQARPARPTQTAAFEQDPGAVDASSPPATKIAFFRALFRSRDDVYAHRWENRRDGRSGWMPAVVGGRLKGVPVTERRYLPLTDKVVHDHLLGTIDVGLYPVLDGDNCCWLAADFDGPAAMLDALAYLKAARAAGAPAALEVSRSGLGAHVWIFFTSPVPAVTAREMGSGLLREAIALRGRMDLRSYDRLFPSQDVLANGGIGNLIAAPLQGRCRRSHTTVFLDLATLEPHEDQFAFLSSLGRMSPREVTRLAKQLGTVPVGTDVTSLRPATATRINIQAPPIVHASLAARITVSGADLPPALMATLKHAATIANPVFYERQRRRASTWDVPRFLRNYDETIDDDLILPRGMIDRLTLLVDQCGSRLDLVDNRTCGDRHTFGFAGLLDAEQDIAAQVLARTDTGILEAPPGAGKTVVACSLIATHGVSTLVLVNRRALADQWRTRIHELLGVRPGQRGGGRAKTTGVVDITTLQTLARARDVAELTAGYGFVIVDECHHVPAAAYEHAIAQIPARRWLGLSATPYRRDQLDELIALQVGPVRHTIKQRPAGTLNAAPSRPSAPEPILRMHTTSFVYAGDADPHEPGGMAKINRACFEDEARNRQITDDVFEALGRGRHCLVLTRQVAHLERLSAALADHDPVVLRGGMGAKARTSALARLSPPGSGSPPLLAIATGSYIGEGFDCPVLDTLFLTAPIAQKGDLVQYVGRVLRSHPGKHTAEVHDYHDAGTGVLASSLSKRAAGYTSLGFPDTRRNST